MQFHYIDKSLQNKWEDLVKSNPASGFMQSFFWTKFTSLLNWPTFKIGLFDEEKLVGGVIVTKFISEKMNYLYIGEGPVIPYGEKYAEEMFHQLIAEVDKIADLQGENLTSHLRIEPKLTNLPDYFSRFQKAPIDEQPLNTLIIDLEKSDQELLEQMRPKGRYNIKVAQRYGVEVTSTNLADGINDFMEFYQQTVDRKGFEGKDEGYFNCLVEACEDSTAAKLYLAKYDSQVLAVALVIFYGSWATYLFGASSNKHRETMAPYLLHWEIITQAKKMGFKKYDFLGVAPDENDQSHPWYGFSVFKKKFGGEQVKYIGAYDYIYSKKLYEKYLKENGEKKQNLTKDFRGWFRARFRSRL